jgi:outer membrane cobalamin receptor
MGGIKMKVLFDLRLVVLAGVMLVGGLLAEAKSQEGPGGFDLGQIIVTATRTGHRLGDVPVAASVITREEIEAKNIKTVQDALVYLTGVRMLRTPGSWGSEGLVQMQGLHPRHTLILVDGQRMFGGHGAVDVHQISVAMVERIEVVKGPASALYGSDALGGVVNIITRPAPDEFTASGSISFGSRRTQVYEVSSGFGEGRWGGFFNFTHRKSDGVRPEYFTVVRGITSKHSDRSKQQIFQGRLEYEFSPVSKLTLKPYYSEHIVQDTLSATETQDRTQERRSINAIWEWIPDEFSVLNLRGSLLNYEHYTEDKRDDWDDDSHEAEIVYSRMLGIHTLTGGYHYQHHKRDDRGKRFSADQTVHSFFLQDEIDLEPATLVLGARLDEHDRWGTEVNPRASILYRVTEALRLRASVGTAFRGPTLTQLYATWMMGPFRVHANPNLRPEESVGYQLGAEYEFSPRTLGKLSLFRNEVENLIAHRIVRRVRPPHDMFFENVAKATTQGMELSLASQIADNLTGRLGYTFLDTKDRITGLELVRRPRNVLTMELNQKVPVLNLNLNLAGRYTGERYDDAANTVRLGSYTVVDLSLTWDVREHTQFFGRLDNILGEKNIVDEYGLDGTEFLAGVRVKF